MASADARYREQSIHPSLSVNDISFIGHTKGASRRLVVSDASNLSIGSVGSSASAQQRVFQQDLLTQKRAERDALEQIRCAKSVSLMPFLAILDLLVACEDCLGNNAARNLYSRHERSKMRTRKELFLPTRVVFDASKKKRQPVLYEFPRESIGMAGQSRSATPHFQSRLSLREAFLASHHAILIPRASFDWNTAF